MKWKFIIGAVVGIGGIAATFLVFGMQRCAESASTRTELSESIDRNQQRFIELKARSKRLSKKQIAIRHFIDKNNEYKRTLSIYQEMDQKIAMATEAIQSMGGRDTGINSRNRAKWLRLLRDAGFKLNEPLREIMSEITQSRIAQSRPVRTLLTTPDRAGSFVDEMRRWQAKTDRWANEFFGKLIARFGRDHPLAGSDLDQYLRSALSNASSRSNDVENQRSDTVSKLRRDRNLIDESDIPSYCSYLP